MRKLSQLLKHAILPIIVVSFGLAAFELWRRLESEPIHVDPWWLAASSAAFAAGNLTLAITFKRVLKAANDVPRPVLAVFELYFRGVLARYLPGKVGVPAVRMSAATEFHVSPVFMAGTVVLESLASVATSGAVAALISMGPWAPRSFRGVTDKPWALPLIVAVFLAVVLLALIDLRHYPAFLRRILRSENRTGALLPWSWLIGCSVCWSCVGLSCALCARALGEADDIALLAAAGGVLGPIVGFLAMLAPGGLGVREAFLVAILAPQIGATRALAFSLVSRAVALGTEFSLWLCARAGLLIGEGRGRAR